MTEPAQPVSLQSILVLEDHPFQRLALVKQLEALTQAEIYQAGEGEEALALLRQMEQPCDLVFCDLQMDGMDGIEFIRHLASEQLGRAITIVSAMEQTLLDTVARMSQAYGVELLGVVQKPVTRVQLQEILAGFDRLSPARETSRAQANITDEQVLSALQAEAFEPFVQPKVRTHDQSLYGVEALARWRDSELGLVSPALFLDTISAHGRCADLTRILLRKSIAAGRQWLDQGLALNIAVNITPDELKDTRVVDQVFALLDEYDFPAHLLTLEITESGIIRELGSTLETLSRLRMGGINIAIDDFGTGFATLDKLTKAPFNELKLDRSYVHGMGKDARKNAIVAATVQMARQLHLQTVAEGVEDDEDRQALDAIDCDLIQGYLISKPMSLSDFSQWSRAYQAH